MARPPCPSLKIFLIIFFGFLPRLLIAAPSCSFSCPTRDENGRPLVISTYATSYSAPYSVFDCMYSIPQIELRICHYSKSDGMNILRTGSGSRCPAQAVPCSDASAPSFSAPEKYEIPPWIAQGNDLLYHRQNPPRPNPAD